jgi:peptidoglycan/xylan/chitin deacetylase (PgdA/CDA1 family)
MGGHWARAEAAPPVEPCATRGDVLGLARIVEVDTETGPQFGRTPAGEFDILADGEVVLTFDDGPSRANTRAVLAALDAHCTKATFFMVGRMAAADPAMVQEVARRGHTVGAHTWSHAKLQTMPFDKAKDEIEMGFSAIARALQGPVAPFFRFPYLRSNPDTVGYLKSRQLAGFGIDVDSRDFETRNGAAVMATVLGQLAMRRKGILLFHDIQPSTAGSIKEILDALKSRGFKVVHLVPKHAATTLARYDTLAENEIASRKLASAKDPLASRAVVWPQTGSGEQASGETLPWTQHSNATGSPTSSKALSKSKRVPWYEWLLP